MSVYGPATTNRRSKVLLLVTFVSLAAAELDAQVVAVPNVQLGPRPFYLVDTMSPGPLQDQLAACARTTTRYAPSPFSIGHRGAALQFPEHTRESYLAAARMGAGALECDVTFTADKTLVCRHAQCDLHTSTNILAIPELAAKCSQAFEPAQLDPATGALIKPASAKCCTSDITLEEFNRLEGKMDASNPRARTVEEYLGGTPNFRTELYTTGGTLMTHAQSIDLFRALGTQMMPELKSPEVPMPFDGFSQQDYAQRLIDEYRAASVPAADVWPQSFDLDDVLYWIAHDADFGRQAVYLDERDPADLATSPPPLAEFSALKARGVNIVAPPMSALLVAHGDAEIVPSAYALRARQAGLDIISWTTERSGRINEDVIPAGGAFYYDTTVAALRNDGDILRTIDVLAQDVGVIGLFSDWPATTTFYANCRALPQLQQR